MEMIWKLQDAKSQFSKVVKDALENGPQFVTRRGAKAVVVLSARTYEALVAKKPGFKEFLLDCPKLDEGFETERSRDYPRDIEL